MTFKRVVFDLETNGFVDYLTKIHTVTFCDLDTNEYVTYDRDDTYKIVDILQNADEIIGHNIIGFDIPAIQKLYPSFKPKGKVTDTLVLARLAWNDIKAADLGRVSKGVLESKLIGSHSLKAYGQRLGLLKGSFGEDTDWKEWSQSMSDYCVQDVRVTVALYNKIIEKQLSPQAVELEHKVATIISRQQRYGFLFDIEKANLLYGELVQLKENIHRELLSIFPIWYSRVEVKTPDKDTKRVKGLPCPTYYYKGASFTKLKLNTFNPGSRDHIAYWLKKKYDWKPLEFTPSGKPKIDEQVLVTLEYSEATKLAQYFLLDKRLGQLSEGTQGWLRTVKSDSRIHGSVNTNGAVTGRMTHSSPNVAQVPSASSPYGDRCRELFCVPKGKKLVGCDASGLELRCLAHFMAKYDDGAYAKEILEGDIHSANQEAAGLPTRNTAKTFIYAFLYGAGDEKIGSIVSGGAAEGKKLKSKFFKKIPAIKKLVDTVQAVSQTKGFLKGLDGRTLPIRSSHAALNVLLQSAGALIMKQSLVILDEDLQSLGYIPGKHYEFVANIHDEFQIEVNKDIAEIVGKVAQEAIRKAGDTFEFRCPLDGEFNIGNNWYETH